MSYNVATITNSSLQSDGKLLLNINFTGNAGETLVPIDLPINDNVVPAINTIRAFAIAQLTRLNANVGAQVLFPPGVIDTTTPLPSSLITLVANPCWEFHRV